MTSQHDNNMIKDESQGCVMLSFVFMKMSVSIQILD